MENENINYKIKIIIDYLNKKLNSKYTYESKDTVKLIQERIKDGYCVDDFKTVIDKKCYSWKNTDMRIYLRPSTLFGKKFGEYLNEVLDRKGEYAIQWENIEKII